MRQKLSFSFRIVFLLGIVLLFISLFLEWYSFQVYDANQELIATWSYNLMVEWSTDLPMGLTTNEEYRPNNLKVPFIFHIIFIVLLVLSTYIIIFRDVNSKKMDSLYRSSFIVIITLFLIIFYMGAFPILYLLPNRLFFPVLTYVDTEAHATLLYSVGIGYIFQWCGFIFVFPYSVHYVLTINAFEKSRQVPERQIESYIEENREPIDLDRFIAEEQVERNYYD